MTGEQNQPQSEECGLVVTDDPRPTALAPVEEWIDYATKLEDANVGLGDAVRRLFEENKKLKAQIKPRHGTKRLPDETVNRIMAAIESGASLRTIAQAHHVSHMTVKRYKKQADQNEAQ